jgi:hypothetical protein
MIGFIARTAQTSEATGQIRWSNMPIFHFNLDDHVREPDLEGTELPDAETARAEAVRFAGAYLRDNPGLIDDGQAFKVEVTDETGKSLFIVRIEATNPK